MNYYNYPQSGRLEEHTKRLSLKDILMVLMIVLGSMNIFEYGIHIVVLFFLLYFISAGRIHYTEALFAPALMTFSLLFFWEDSLNGPTTIVKSLVWPMAFLLGYEATNMETWDEVGAQQTEKKVNRYILLVAIGFFAHFALNFYFNMGETYLGRNTKDVWSKEVRAATGQAALACIPLGWSIASFMNNTGIRKRIPALIVIAIVLMYNLVLSTRTLFLMLLIITLVAVLYLVFAANKSKKKLYVVLAVLVVLAFVVIGYRNNLFNMKEQFDSSEFHSRFYGKNSEDISEDGRLDRKRKYLERMPLNLWGGGHIRRYTGSYAHDLLLDLYDDAGILALIAAVMMVVGSVVVLVRLLKNGHVKFETRMMLLCVFMAMYMEFMVEPIFIGAPDLLMMFCFLYGVTTRMDKNLRLLHRMNFEATEKGSQL